MQGFLVAGDPNDGDHSHAGSHRLGIAVLPSWAPAAAVRDD